MGNSPDQKTVDIIRAWKEESYRASLPAEVQALIPEAPENVDELSAEALREAAGAAPTPGFAASQWALALPGVAWAAAEGSGIMDKNG